jgi:hypothetical protein
MQNFAFAMQAKLYQGLHFDAGAKLQKLQHKKADDIVPATMYPDMEPFVRLKQYFFAQTPHTWQDREVA